MNHHQLSRYDHETADNITDAVMMQIGHGPTVGGPFEVLQHAVSGVHENVVKPAHDNLKKVLPKQPPPKRPSSNKKNWWDWGRS